MSFGKNLQTLRQRVGLSQSELAAKAGIPVKTIQNWEISRRTPRWIVLLVKLATGLGVPMEELTAGAAVEADPAQPRRRAARMSPTVPSTPPAGELEVEAEAVGKKRRPK
jgi:transcriptional regulator with XRE-family HTH domain